MAKCKRCGLKTVLSEDDIQKMVELKRLGVFSSAHEKALLKVMGVDSLTRADISTVEDVAKIMDDEIGMRKMTDEYREKYKSQRDEKKEKADLNEREY